MPPKKSDRKQKHAHASDEEEDNVPLQDKIKKSAPKPAENLTCADLVSRRNEKAIDIKAKAVPTNSKNIPYSRRESVGKTVHVFWQVNDPDEHGNYEPDEGGIIGTLHMGTIDEFNPNRKPARSRQDKDGPHRIIFHDNDNPWYDLTTESVMWDNGVITGPGSVWKPANEGEDETKPKRMPLPKKTGRSNRKKKGESVEDVEEHPAAAAAPEKEAPAQQEEAPPAAAAAAAVEAPAPVPAPPAADVPSLPLSGEETEIDIMPPAPAAQQPAAVEPPTNAPIAAEQPAAAPAAPIETAQPMEVEPTKVPEPAVVAAVEEKPAAEEGKGKNDEEQKPAAAKKAKAAAEKPPAAAPASKAPPAAASPSQKRAVPEKRRREEPEKPQQQQQQPKAKQQRGAQLQQEAAATTAAPPPSGLATAPSGSKLSDDLMAKNDKLSKLSDEYRKLLINLKKTAREMSELADDLSRHDIKELNKAGIPRTVNQIVRAFMSTNPPGLFEQPGGLDWLAQVPEAVTVHLLNPLNKWKSGSGKGVVPEGAGVKAWKARTSGGSRSGAGASGSGEGSRPTSAAAAAAAAAARHGTKVIPPPNPPPRAPPAAPPAVVEPAKKPEKKDDDGYVFIRSTGNEMRDKAVQVLAHSLVTPTTAMDAAAEMEMLLFTRYCCTPDGGQAQPNEEYYKTVKRIYEALSPKSPTCRPLLRFMLHSAMITPSDLVTITAEELLKKEEEAKKEMLECKGGWLAENLRSVQLPYKPKERESGEAAVDEDAAGAAEAALAAAAAVPPPPPPAPETVAAAAAAAAPAQEKAGSDDMEIE